MRLLRSKQANPIWPKFVMEYDVTIKSQRSHLTNIKTQLPLKVYREQGSKHPCILDVYMRFPHVVAILEKCVDVHTTPSRHIGEMQA